MSGEQDRALADTKADSVESVRPEAETEPNEEPADRRLSLRRKKLMRVVIRIGPSGEHLNGWVFDRSLGGMCITLDQPIDSGTLLAVRRPSAPESVPWVALRVRNVRPFENSWEIGCEFVRTPNWEVLVQFE